MREVHDRIRVERNEHRLMQDEDKVVDTKIRVKLEKWKVRFTVSAIVKLIFVLWKIWC